MNDNDRGGRLMVMQGQHNHPAEVSILDRQLKKIGRKLLAGGETGIFPDLEPGQYVVDVKEARFAPWQIVQTITGQEEVTINLSESNPNLPFTDDELGDAMENYRPVWVQSFQALVDRLPWPGKRPIVRGYRGGEEFEVKYTFREHTTGIRLVTQPFTHIFEDRPRVLNAPGWLADDFTLLLDLNGLWPLKREIVAVIPAYLEGVDVQISFPKMGVFVQPHSDEGLRVSSLLSVLHDNGPISSRELWMRLGVSAEDHSSENMDYLAYKLMRDKFLDPYKAVVAGLYILRFGMWDTVRDWTRNLADFFPAVPDGCVIEGWRRLTLQGDNANPQWPEWRLQSPPPPSRLNSEPNAPRPDDPIEDACLRFLEAEARGIPIFHMSLLKLVDGLALCREQLSKREDQVLLERVDAALERTVVWQKKSFSTGGLTSATSFKELRDPFF